MADQNKSQIIFRHVAGAKINQIDPFDLAKTREIAFGRDNAADVRFDDPRDDVVSRRHAVLRVTGDGSPCFSIEDLNSSNGTFVNGGRVFGETELLPEDIVEFGRGGPKFVFDVQPRPALLASRTRIMNAFDATVTRVVDATVSRAASTGVTTLPAQSPAGSEPGGNSVAAVIADEHRTTGHVWLAVGAALVAFLAVGGGATYFRLHREAEAQRARIAAEASSAAAPQINPLTQHLSLGPGEIVGKFGNSTVWINFSWRLFDKETGRPVFQKALTRDHRTLPAYLKIDGKIYPWFTTEDDEHHNYEMKVTGAGSGFVVNDQGFILTNKHVAAGWMVSVDPDEFLGHYGVRDAYIVTLAKKKGSAKVESIEVESLRQLPDAIQDWTPAEDPAVLFNSKGDILEGSLHGGAMATPSNNATLFGKNELLEVRFPGSSVSINAANIRQSMQADAALLKIDSPQALTPVDLSTDDSVKVGERVTVLGYPGVSMSTVMKLSSNEAGQKKDRTEVIPEPTVTEGIVSKLGAELTQTGTTTVAGTLGDAFQLGINTTGAGNSGGPVFDANGKVIGLFTYRSCEGSTCVTDAVPIKHGRNLLNPQRAQ